MDNSNPEKLPHDETQNFVDDENAVAENQAVVKLKKKSAEKISKQKSEAIPTTASKHVMVNHSAEIRRSEENLQRYDKLKKVFSLLKKEWPYCFDNTQESYLSRAEIAVS